MEAKSSDTVLEAAAVQCPGYCTKGGGLLFPTLVSRGNKKNGITENRLSNKDANGHDTRMSKSKAIVVQ